MNWNRVCTVNEVAAGSLKEFDVNGVPALTANLGDAFRTFPPVCPHMEEPLEYSGFCNSDILICSKHL